MDIKVTGEEFLIVSIKQVILDFLFYKNLIKYDNLEMSKCQNRSV